MATKVEEERHRREVVHMFRSAPFEEIVAHSEAKVSGALLLKCTKLHIHRLIFEWAVSQKNSRICFYFEYT